MKKLLLRPFIKGSMVLLPLLVTVWLVWSALAWLNDLGASALHFVSPDLVLFPGVGLLVMLITLMSVGLLFQFNPISWVYQYVEDAFLRLPLVKTLYGAVKDFAAMFDGDKPQAQQVVLVEFEQMGQVVGFITSNNIPDAVARVNARKDLVAVYFPMSYMVGGYTLFLPRERLTPVDWSVEDAMRFAVTAGISQSQARVRQEPSATPKASDTDSDDVPENQGAGSQSLL